VAKYCKAREMGKGETPWDSQGMDTRKHCQGNEHLACMVDSQIRAAADSDKDFTQLVRVPGHNDRE
jgi:hypothetical protein